MANQVKTILITTIGIFFVVFGIVGFFLPFFQGILSLCIGIILLSVSSPWVRVRVEGFLQKYPRFAAHHARAYAIIKKIFRLP